MNKFISNKGRFHNSDFVCGCMEHNVFVIQIVADGNEGFPNDEIAEIAIVGVDLKTMECEAVYSEILNMDPKEMGKSKLDYLEQNSGLLAADLYNGVPLEKVAEEVKAIISGKDVACYDVQNTMFGYLLNQPWRFSGVFTSMPQISSRIDSELKARSRGEENEKIRLAYDKLCPGDPMNVKDGKRALDVAFMSSAILMQRRKDGFY